MMKQKEGHFQGADRASVYYRYWKPLGEYRAVIVVVHGAAEHSGRYEIFAEHFVALGYAVVALDHIGHGQSDGQRVFIRSFDDYVQTLDLFCAQVRADFPDSPQILLGHSLGGLISSTYLLQADKQQQFAGCVLSGPAIKTDLEPPMLQLLAIRFFSWCLPKLGVLQLDAAGVSRDPAEVERYRNDPLNYGGKLTARLVAELFRVMQRVQANAASIELPILLLHGGEDSMASPQGSRFLDEHISSTDKTLKIYPGLYHEIFNEPERLQVFADIEQWLQRVLPTAADQTDAAPAQS